MHAGLVEAENRGANFGGHLLVTQDEVSDPDTTGQFIGCRGGEDFGVA